MLKNIDLHLISDFGRFGLDVDLSLNSKICLSYRVISKGNITPNSIIKE
ncbi:hypothetical protein [Rivularia sp. PCC 7116]|nr:hypothetical protein [Rivularia sp. PCC 7116]